MSTASISRADRMRFSLVKAVPPASSMPAAGAAEFSNSGDLDLRFGSWGTTRESLDYNFQIVPDQVAFRLDLLHDDEKYEQQPAYSKDQRISGALRVEPAFLNKNGNQDRLQGELRMWPGRFRQSSRASSDGPHHSVFHTRRYRRLSGGTERFEFVGIAASPLVTSPAPPMVMQVPAVPAIRMPIRGLRMARSVIPAFR